MAEIQLPITITGTFKGVTYYTRNGKKYIRKKTNLDKKRIMEDPAFEKLAASSNIMAIASPIASKVYQQLGGKKDKKCYNRLTGYAQQLLKGGMDANAVQGKLIEFAKMEFGLDLY